MRSIVVGSGTGAIPPPWFVIRALLFRCSREGLCRKLSVFHLALRPRELMTVKPLRINDRSTVTETISRSLQT
jgi:hypothetical protein